ncbi:glycerol-3-phosphate acyltransferase 1, mitochondrial isoform X2 [Tribolium castaneum]|uniref:glycerol-3-phosphate acyltransferase 1, mitochondrial isoform X2 n=1 Tax=Tribolium castaneum TaxID=7070 RepID=UPI00046C3920|nr:PREDICTED: glycerol-3-phosphate acyltransferase 1, mitochondrial isoform X2 [Tribolium castaneum]|eukprot:XP_008197640.1 PREDICTED: glycerol-3-phosphate acyltransferase 1, mitochondrial isoform X2 [Tribolium castaneum]
MEGVIECVILMGFMYWAFPSFFSEGFSRVNKMVDIVTNRIFDSFSRFSPKENHQTESLTTISHLKRFSKGNELRRRNFLKDDLKERDSHLYDIKENVAEVELPPSRPLMGLSCDYCTSASRESLVNKTTEKFALNNILDHTPSLDKNGFLQRTFSHLNQVYQLRKFDYPQVAEIVLKDDRLKKAIEKTALQQYQDSERNDDEFYQELLKNNHKRAKKLLYGMRSTLSDFLLRFTSWVLYKLLPCFLSCVVAHPGQINMLKEAGKTSLPLIFLPLHRSHLDYILISFILLNNNVRSPLVAAGDNLRIPFFGSLLRGLGAFFIKRRIDPVMGRKDHLYKAVLHTYMNECLRAGHNMEFFLEGGRTRTGKPCMPKYGILSVIVEAFMDGTIEDALLVPVSVNYEKLVDGNFVREQLGQPKEMETFGAAIKGIWHVLNSDYGMMRIDFNQPFSLRELVKTFNASKKLQNGFKKMLKSNPSTTSLYGTDVVSDEHKSVVESISKHIIYDCARSTSVMSTNALAFLLLTKFREGATIEQLVAALDSLRHELDVARKDLGFTGDSIDVVNYAIELLGPGLVRKEKINGEDIIKPMAILPNVIELTYYSNTLVTHYALESIVAISLNMVATKAGTVSHLELIETVLDLCNVLQYEFILCKPCQNLEHVVIGCLDDLNVKYRIFVEEVRDDEQVARSKKIAQEFEDEDLDEAATEKPYVLSNEKGAVERLRFMQGLLMPLVETYAVSAFTLEKLVGRSLLENELISDILSEIKLQIAEGTVKYDESVSVDPIKNALKLYQKWDVLECHTENKLRLYYLKESQDNSDAVKTLYQRINKFRQSV